MGVHLKQHGIRQPSDQYSALIASKVVRPLVQVKANTPKLFNVQSHKVRPLYLLIVKAFIKKKINDFCVPGVWPIVV